MKQIKIALLLGDTILSRRLINLFNKNKKFQIIFIQSNLIIKKYTKDNLNKKYIWVSNKTRNEKKISEISKSKKVEIIISSQHPWILSEKLITTLKGNIFNCHFGKLPEYRGHDPINYSIINKEKYCYSTFHIISKKVDDGYIVSQKKIYINKKTPREIEILMSKNFVNQVKLFLEKYIYNKKFNLKKVSSNNSNYYKFNDIKKIKNIKKITNSLHKIQALNHPPHEPAFIKINNQKIYLLTNYNDYLNYKKK